jgi:hypothetical protein
VDDINKYYCLLHKLVNKHVEQMCDAYDLEIVIGGVSQIGDC